MAAQQAAAADRLRRRLSGKALVSMKLFDTRLMAIIAFTVLAGLGTAHWYGSKLAGENPNGLWLQTPVDANSWPAPPAYPMGFGFALFCVFAVTLVPSIILAVTSRLKSESAVRLAKQLMLNTVVSGALFLVADQLVNVANAH